MAIQREQILRVAFELLDEGGIEGLSLRKLACRLGIRAPSLYWHFTNKQALIDAMADALIHDVARDIPPGQHWRRTLHQLARELRQAFKAHRDGARVYAGTYIASENTLRVGEACMAALVEAGADATFAATTAMDIGYYVMGLVIEEQSLPDAGTHLTQLLETFREMAGERYPLCLQASGILSQPAFDARLENGVNLLLDGMQQRLRAGAIDTG